MNSKRANLKRAVKTWVLPPGWLALLERLRTRVDVLKTRMQSGYQFSLENNKALVNRHHGERCFILCNGPSVKHQDLLPLRNEIVISVSSGYLHKDFDNISPRYHCVPNVTWNCLPHNTIGELTEAHVIEWFKEMDRRIGNAELFLGHTEYGFVKSNKLFDGRKIHYLCMERAFIDQERVLIDLSTVIPTPQSVPIMALMVAMYLGFKQIYLLGTDHDSLQQGTYNYAFEPTVTKGFGGVDSEGKVTAPMYTELMAYAELWSQYRHLKRIAESNGAQIFNATHGGALDEFERVELSSLWEPSASSS